MYAKLILRNARRSIKDYLIYIVTLTLCVAMFYSFLSISSRYYKPDIGVEFDLTMLSDGMKLAIVCVTLLLLFLIRYVNQYMLRRRQREFALQTIMGMEQRTTAHIFFMETLLMGLLAIVCGIALGAVISQMITAMLLSFYGTAFTITWMLFPDTICQTFVFFILSFTFIGFWNTRTIRRIKIIDMLQADRINEDSVRKSRYFPAVTLLYLLLLLFMTYTGMVKYHSYYDSRHPLPVLIMFWGNMISPAFSLLLSVLWAVRCRRRNFHRLAKLLLAGLPPVVIFAAMVPLLEMRYHLAFGQGTLNSYLLFLAAIMAYLVCNVIYLSNSFTADSKNNSLQRKYHEENLFFYGQILSRLKTSTKSMTLISLTLTFSIALFLVTPALVEWALGYLDSRSVFDVTIFTSYSRVSEESMLPDDDYTFVTDYLEEQGVVTREACLFSTYLPQAEQFHNRVKYNFPVLGISLSDYNRLRSMTGLAPVTLEDTEFATQWNAIVSQEDIRSFLDSHQKLETDAGALTLAEEGAYNAQLSEYIYNSYTDVIYILPDKICHSLLSVGRSLYISAADPIPYQTSIGLEQLFTRNRPLGEDGAGYYIRTRSQQISSTTASTFVMKASMIYGAIVLLISAFTILSLQQLSEADEFGSRFRILHMIGVEEDHIQKLILKQLGFWFGLPIAVSITASVIFAAYFFFSIAPQINAYIGAGRLFAQVGAIVFILFLLLVCYFLTTWILFRRSIAQERYNG